MSGVDPKRLADNYAQDHPYTDDHVPICNSLGIEFWRPIPDFSGYQISTWGRILSVMPWRGSSDRLLKQDFNKHTGYFMICLRRNRERHKDVVHRLMAKTYLRNPDGKATVNHKDGNRRNNHISNLEWATYSENSFHKCRVLGYGCGENNPAAKITDDDAQEIKALRFYGAKLKDIGDAYGLTIQGVSAITNGYCRKSA